MYRFLIAWKKKLKIACARKKNTVAHGDFFSAMQQKTIDGKFMILY